LNFVFHHHLAARDLGSPAAGAGAMLPDLWRMADRRVRARSLGASPSTVEASTVEASEVLAGIEHHLAVDRWFHGDAVFLDGERAAVERLRGARIAAPRMALFAHVLWEMCLDGALLRVTDAGAVLASLREGIREARAGAAARAVELHHFARAERTAEEREAFERRMERILDEVARGPWVEGYRTGEGIAARLAGVRARVGVAPLEGDDLARVAGVAEALLDQAPPSVHRILDLRVRFDPASS
jgi:hypothetical protein